MPWRVLINSIIIKCGAAHSSRLLRKRRERLEWLRQTRFFFFHSCWSTTLSPRFKMKTSPTTINCKTMMEMFCAACSLMKLEKNVLGICNVEFLPLSDRLYPLREKKKKVKKMPQSSSHCRAIARRSFLSSLCQRLPPEPDSSHSTIALDPKKATPKVSQRFLIQIAGKLRDRRSRPSTQQRALLREKEKEKAGPESTVKFMLLLCRQKSDVELRERTAH